MKKPLHIASLLMVGALVACNSGGRDAASVRNAAAQQRAACALAPGAYTQTWQGRVGTTALGVDVDSGEHVAQLSLPEGCHFASAEVLLSWEALAREDLDLQVTLPGGSSKSAESGAIGSESLSLAADVTAGTYTLRVYGYNSVDTDFSGEFVAQVVAAPGDDGEASLPVEVAGSGRGVDDVVVVAVIDSGLNPYHWDFLAAKMPQHNNAGEQDDLPLDQDPATWLPGHPGAKAFASYQALNLSVAEAGAGAGVKPSELHAQDQDEWAKIRYSEGKTNDAINMYWVPGTKVIGHVAFGGAFGVVEPTTSHVVEGALGPASGPIDTFRTESHGIGSASVSVGNLHGTCPSCVLVYVHGPSEWANEWVASQDWIDLQTNSWGLSLTGAAVRDNIYAGSDTEAQRLAIERGQSWFQSAGNGMANAFTVPSSTLLSSQKGPDWIVTVGAIEPEGSSVGHNRPVDLSSLGSDYPSATGGGDSVTAEGDFSGTSNATPVIAGLYGQALYNLRRLLDGPSRVQAAGVVAVGPAGCGPANAACALADGQVSVHEMQQALFLGAEYSAGGTTLLYQIGGPDIPGSENSAELEFVSEGHGSYYGRMLGEDVYRADVQRIVDLAMGQQSKALSAEQQAWLIADSHCRQSIWGSWAHGYYDGGNAPAADLNWPIRSWLSDMCPQTLPSAVQALRVYGEISEF